GVPRQEGAVDDAIALGSLAFCDQVILDAVLGHQSGCFLCDGAAQVIRAVWGGGSLGHVNSLCGPAGDDRDPPTIARLGARQNNGSPRPPPSAPSAPGGANPPSPGRGSRGNSPTMNVSTI